MDLDPWKLAFRIGWDRHFKDFDKGVRETILKKLDKMKEPLQGRGLQASRYQVEEAGQYRIAFVQDNELRTKDIHFIGNHKQYEKWFRTLPL